MASSGISEIVGLVCLVLHRPVLDDDDCAVSGLLRIGITANCASLLYSEVRPSIVVGLSDLRFQPRAILSIAYDFGRGTRPCHKGLGYDPRVISFGAADIRTSRTTTSQPVKLSSALRLLATDALHAFRDTRRTQ